MNDTLNTFRLTLAAVDFDGDIEAARGQSLAHEIRLLADGWAAFDLPLARDIELKVLLTDQMERNVDRVRAEYGVTGFPPYSRVRAAALPVAIAIPAPDGPPPARVTVILDHQVEMWRADDSVSIVSRVFLLAHEIGHALEHGKDAAPPPPMAYRTYAEFSRAVAYIVHDEYAADLFGNVACSMAFADQQVDVPRLLLEAHGDLGSIRELCARLCSLSADVTAVQHNPCMTTADRGRLQSAAFSLLQEVAIVLAHAVNCYSPCGMVDVLRSTLDGLPGFKAYLAEGWMDFGSGMTDEDRERGEALLLRFIDGALARLGLRFEDSPQGIWLGYTRPASLGFALLAGLARLAATVPSPTAIAGRP